MPVEYHANKKTWMTSGIFGILLKKFETRMSYKSQKVLLFLDIAMSYSYIRIRNVKLKFLPANTA